MTAPDRPDVTVTLATAERHTVTSLLLTERQDATDRADSCARVFGAYDARTVDARARVKLLAAMVDKLDGAYAAAVTKTSA